MAHSYVSSLFHCVFSTKERRRTITVDIQDRLWHYMGGVARQNNICALAIGGIEDHVHLLLAVPSTMSVSKAMQLIKGGSSKWVHHTFPRHRGFEWQEGYGAFTISVSQIENTKNYISHQQEHHRVRTFQEEYIVILERHGIEYDLRFLWG